MQQSELDLEAYFARIEYGGSATRDAETLRAIHRAHATHIAFENFDVLLGKTIRLDLASLQTKLVHDRRGGYCFEQNALLARALEQIGFPVTRLAARVRFGATRLLPRTHMALLVEADAEPWLADVGFGGWGLIEPIILRENVETREGNWTFHLRREGAEWILVCPGCPLAADQYAFTLEPQQPVDYEPPNHFCATHPDSPFVQTLTAQLPSETARYILRGREFTTIDVDGSRAQSIADEDELRALLRERFQLLPPAGKLFR